MFLSIITQAANDFSGIGSFISQVGVPTALCVYLIYTNKKNNDKHAEEIEKLRETVENNTKAMIKLSVKMGVDADG